MQKQDRTDAQYQEDVNNLTSHTVPPSGRQQSITGILKSFSTTSSNDSRLRAASKRFLEDLALRSRNRFQSKRRVFRDMSDGVAFLLMTLQMIIWVLFTFISLGGKEASAFDHETFWQILKFTPIFISISMALAALSSLFLYFFTEFTIHTVSLSVLGFCLYIASANLLWNGTFSSGNFFSLLTFLFLAIYYIRGLKHLPLTCKFIQSAARICWRNSFSILFVFASYALVLYAYILTWSTSCSLIQNSPIFTGYTKFAVLFYSLVSLMLVSSFLRDLLQIWLSRIIYTSTFAYPSRQVIVTSLTKRSSGCLDIEATAEAASINESDSEYEETQRIVTRESMWWCVGTASRSAFHLVLRAFQIHIWILALIQIVFPNFGPPADPKCVLDVFHVPTAIYGTSFTKSRRFVADTMVDHGMDKISVDLYLRTFIYYMISYACGVLSLATIGKLFGPQYEFKLSFLVDAMWSVLTHATPVNYTAIIVGFSVILYYTAIDSVHMILCWSICESPTSVSALEPELMGLLVTEYHARLDLRRFTGDRIHASFTRS